jgi:hypothetical protein
VSQVVLDTDVVSFLFKSDTRAEPFLPYMQDRRQVISFMTEAELEQWILQSHLFNHTNFSNPVSNERSASFGNITSTVGSAVAKAVGTTAGLVGGGPRVVQFSMRLQF